MKVRRLTEHGLNLFEQFVFELRLGIGQSTPLYLLDAENSSEEIELDIEVENRIFDSRYEMGCYLEELLKGKDIQQHLGDPGFWSWFALLWFDQLCPVKSNGQKNPSMPYHYVLSRKYNHRPRHAIFSSWQLVHLYGERSRFLLCNEMYKRGELVEQLLARQGILTCRGVMELASDLYLDTETGRFKRGAAARKSAGCVTRLVGWLQQIELTYDVFSSNKEDLMELLPAEFDRFVAN